METTESTSEVTEYSWTEQELGEFQERFSQLFSPDFQAIIIHQKVRILDANQTAMTLFGYESSEIIRLTVLDLAAPEARGVLFKNIALKLETPYEVIGLKKDGVTFPVEILGQAISYQGRMVRAIAVREISGRKLAEVLEMLEQTRDELADKRRESTELKYSNERLQVELAERQRIEAELKARVRQQAVVAELGQRALASTDLATLMDEAVSMIAKTLEVGHSRILEFIPDEDTLLLRAGVGWKEGVVGQARIDIGTGSQEGYTLVSPKPVIVKNFAQETRFNQSLLLREHHVVSGISVIIQGQDRPFGILGAHSTKPRMFAEDDVHFLQGIANVLAMATERKQSEARIVKRNRQLFTLQKATAAISSTLDLNVVLHHIAAQMARAINVTSAYICSFEPETLTTTVLAEYIDPQACPAEQRSELGRTYDLERNFPGAFEFLHIGEPGVVHVNDPDLSEPKRAHMQQFGIQTTLTLPLQVGGKTIAYAELWESRQRREFTPEEITLCQGIAQQAAIAIQNARLFEQRKAVLEDTAALYRVARNLVQMDNEQQMFELALTEYLQRLDLQQGGVLLIDDDKAYGTLKAHMVDGQLVEPGLQFPVADNPSYERLITTKEPVVINDVSHDKLLEPVRELTLKLGTKSLLLVPIMVRSEVIGALGADATETMHQFTGREISLIRAMANQLGIAIENFRLNAETQRRAEQLTVLNELDRAITTSLRLTDIYYAFAQHAIRLLPYHRTSITLLEGDEMRVTYVAGEATGRNGLSVGSMVSPQKSALGWVIEHGQPLLRHNIAADIRSAEDEQLLVADIRSTMIIPLRVKGLIIGTWNIGNRQVGAYSPDDLEIAQSMADQLALAIENARLYDEIRQRLNELSTLSKISQTITSTLDVHETLSIITDHTTQLLGVAAASVALYNEAEDDLWFAASSGGSADFVRGKRMTKSRGIMGWVVRHGEPVLIPDVSKDERFFGEIDQESGFKTRSILCVPLQTKGQTIGAIEAMNKASGPFNQEDLRLLTSLAAPAATAIENARLYEQAQQEIIERQRAEAALEEERALLARRVAERTADLSAANAELARAARLKDEFMASMSHELRTPLTAILGLSEVLKSEVYGSLSEKQLKSVNSVEESGRHLLSLINDILDLSKIGAGKLELKVGSVSVEKVCHASLQFIKQAAHKKQLRITSTYDNTVTTLYADERRLKQILVNLLSNAVKFTPEGGEIGLEVAGDVADQMIHFIVWDTGIGIAPEDQERLFEPFAQLDSRLSRQYPGTGLGLALVQRMAEMHSGEVTLESEVGQGSRFTVSLPWSDFVHPAESVESIALSTQATVAESPDQEETTGLVSPSAQPPLILVAEDEESVANLLMDYLLSRGYRVVVARNGLEALERAREEKPDVILMDIQMPEMDGLETIRSLRIDTDLATIPIIALTALAMPGDRERCLEAGANDYLSKPVNLKKLVKAIQTYLDRIEVE